MSVEPLHIFLFLVITLIISKMVNFKFLILCIVFGCIWYIYRNNVTFTKHNVKSSIMHDDLENMKKDINIFMENALIFSFNKELKHNIITKTNNYINNIAFLYYRDVRSQLCNHYMDILNDEKYDILNMARSYVITTKELLTYKPLEDEMIDFQQKLDALFNLISKKCLYEKIPFTSYNSYNQQTSYQQF